MSVLWSRVTLVMFNAAKADRLVTSGTGIAVVFLATKLASNFTFARGEVVAKHLTFETHSWVDIKIRNRRVPSKVHSNVTLVS